MVKSDVCQTKQIDRKVDYTWPYASEATGAGSPPCKVSKQSFITSICKKIEDKGCLHLVWHGPTSSGERKHVLVHFLNLIDGDALLCLLRPCRKNFAHSNEYTSISFRSYALRTA